MRICSLMCSLFKSSVETCKAHKHENNIKLAIMPIEMSYQEHSAS